MSTEIGLAVTIVSGLPRSGTSLIMQMLQAGDKPALTDGIHRADIDNPRGYLEFEPVKRIATDSSWLVHARGKAVKMAYPLLHFLPDGHSYRVIIPHRNPREVVASQNAMLKRLGKPPAAVPDESLALWLEARLSATEKWLAQQPNFTVLNLAHECLIGSPYVCAEQLSKFCGGLNVAAMAAIVNVSLHRQRFVTSG